MAAHNLGWDSSRTNRERICARCIRESNILIKALGATSTPITDYLEKENLVRIESDLVGKSAKDALNIWVDSLPVGRYALQETFLKYKINDLYQFDKNSNNDYIVNLRNVLLTFFSARNFVAKLRPDRIVTYSSGISTNFTMMKVAERANVPVFGIHAGSNMARRLSELYVFRGEGRQLLRSVIKNFEEKFGNDCCDETSLINVSKHIYALMDAKNVFVYSAPKANNLVDIRSRFSIKTNQKILLVAMSSYDEIVSAQMMGVVPSSKLLFKNQIEWIRFLIGLARYRSDLFFIIRIHPREFPNKREPNLSNHALQLKDTLGQLPENVQVNWPTDNISLYDIMLQCNVVLCAWSSVGKEAALFGLPVVSYAKDVLLYPLSFISHAETEQDYLKMIDLALEKGASSEIAVKAFRWFAHEYTFATINIEDAVPLQNGRLKLFRRIVNRLLDFAIPSQSHFSDIRRLRRPLKEADKFVKAIVEQADIHAIQFQNRKLIDSKSEKRIVGQILRNIEGVNKKILVELGVAATELERDDSVR